MRRKKEIVGEQRMRKDRDLLVLENAFCDGIILSWTVMHAVRIGHWQTGTMKPAPPGCVRVSMYSGNDKFKLINEAFGRRKPARDIDYINFSADKYAYTVCIFELVPLLFQVDNSVARRIPEMAWNFGDMVGKRGCLDVLLLQLSHDFFKRDFSI